MRLAADCVDSNSDLLEKKRYRSTGSKKEKKQKLVPNKSNQVEKPSKLIPEGSLLIEALAWYVRKFPEEKHNTQVWGQA